MSDMSLSHLAGRDGTAGLRVVWNAPSEVGEVVGEGKPQVSGGATRRHRLGVDAVVRVDARLGFGHIGFSGFDAPILSVNFA